MQRPMGTCDKMTTWIERWRCYLEGVFLFDFLHRSCEIAELVHCLHLAMRVHMGTTTMTGASGVLGGINKTKDGIPGCRHGWGKASEKNAGSGDGLYKFACRFISGKNSRLAVVAFPILAQTREGHVSERGWSLILFTRVSMREGQYDRRNTNSRYPRCGGNCRAGKAKLWG